MNSRERIRTIISGQAADRVGFWLGNPHGETWPIYYAYFGTTDQREIRRRLGDDYLWVCPELIPGSYRHPAGKPMFGSGVKKTRHGAPGPFADCEDPRDVDDYEWPKAEYLDFGPCLEVLRGAGDLYRASGMWTPFYHNVMDLFGMENYLTKMYTHPEVVLAVTDKVCEFYYEANDVCRCKCRQAQGAQLADTFAARPFAKTPHMCHNLPCLARPIPGFRRTGLHRALAEDLGILSHPPG